MKNLIFRILKNDLKRKRVMNIILLIFVIMAAMFLASSLNNVAVITSALDFYMDKGAVSDYAVVLNNVETDTEKVEKDWDDCKDIQDYELSKWMFFTSDQVKISEKKYKSNCLMFLSTASEDFNSVFSEDEKSFTLKKGEIAIPAKEASPNKIKIGDKIVLKIGDRNVEFKVKVITKDAFLGSSASMLAVSRFIVCKEDFSQLLDDENIVNDTYYIKTKDVTAVKRFISKKKYSVYVGLSREEIKLTHYFDVIIAYAIMGVGLVIILIAFLLLRFTITFTIQDDYRQIGIMKAIGLKNRQIRGIYMIKYFAITLVGSIIGLGLSFPISDLLLKEVRKNIIMESSRNLWWINVLACVAVVLIVSGHCYVCTGKLKKFSAIEAIQNGGAVERRNSRFKMKLNRHKHMTATSFLSLNDIFSNLRRYLVIILTFAVGISLVITPANILNVMSGDAIITMADIPVEDFYLSTDHITSPKYYMDKDKFKKEIEKIEHEYKEEGMDISLYPLLSFAGYVYADDENDSISLSSLKLNVGYDMSKFSYEEGKAPEKEDEVAVARKTADELKIKTGDKIHIVIGEDKKLYKVASIYSSISNGGTGIRFSSKADLDYHYINGVGMLTGVNHTDYTNAELIKKMKEKHSGYKIYSNSKYAKELFGDMSTSIDQIKKLIFVLIILINAFIALLMAKSFIAKETKEIAMLKNLGYKNMSIRRWQMLRLVFSMIIGIFLGIAFSVLLDKASGSIIFGMFGATDINVTSFSFSVYILSPLIVLLINVAAAWLSTYSVKKVKLLEVNSQN